MPDDKKSKIGKVWAKIIRKDKDKELGPEVRGRLSRDDFDSDPPECSTSWPGVRDDWDDNRSSDDHDRPGANLNPRGMGEESPQRNRGTRWPDSSDDEVETFEDRDPWGQRQQRINSMDRMQDYESLSSSPETREPVRSATLPVSPTFGGLRQRVQRRPSLESENADRIGRNVTRRENSPSRAGEEDEEDEEDEEAAQIRLAKQLSLQMHEDEEYLRVLELSRIEAEQRNRDQNKKNATDEALLADVMERSRLDQLRGRRPRQLEKTVQPAQRSNLTQSPVENSRPAVTQRSSTPNVPPQVERPPLPTQRSTPNVHPPAEKPRLGLAPQRITSTSRPFVDSPSQVTSGKSFSAARSEPLDFETRLAIAESLRTATVERPTEVETSRVSGLPGAWHYDEDDGRYNTNRRFDPPAVRPPSPVDEESDDDIYGPPVIGSSVPTQGLDADIYGPLGIESSRAEPEHATSLSVNRDNPSVEARSYPSFSQPEVEPQIESNMLLVRELTPPPRVPTPVLPNDKLPKEPSIPNIGLSESQTTLSDLPAKSRVSSSPLPASEEINKPPSPLNVVETAPEVPTDESNSPNQNALPVEPFRALFETALRTYRPLQTPNISSVSNTERMKSVPILGQPNGQQADQEIHSGDNVEGSRPVDLSPTRHIIPLSLSTTSLDHSTPRDRSLPTSPASTTPPPVSVRVPSRSPVKPLKLTSVRPSVIPSHRTLSNPSARRRVPPTPAPLHTESVRASPPVEPIDITPTHPIITPSSATSNTPRERASTSSPASLPRPTEPIPVRAPVTRTFLSALETSAEALDYFIPPENFDVIASRPLSSNVNLSRISVSQETRTTPAADASNGFPSTSFSPASIFALTEPNASHEYFDKLDSSIPFLPANIFGLSNANPEHLSSVNDRPASTNLPTPLSDTLRPSETNATSEFSAYSSFPSSVSSPSNVPRPSQIRIANHVLPDDDLFPSTPFSPVSILALSNSNVDHFDVDDDLFPTLTFSLPNTGTPIVTSDYDASSNPRSPLGQRFSDALESEVQSGSTSLFPTATGSSTNLHDSYNLSSPTWISGDTIPYEPNFSAILSERNLAPDGRDDDARSVFIPPASWNQPAVFDDPRLDSTAPPAFDVSAILSRSSLPRDDSNDEYSSSPHDPLSVFVPPANFSK